MLTNKIVILSVQWNTMYGIYFVLYGDFKRESCLINVNAEITSQNITTLFLLDVIAGLFRTVIHQCHFLYYL